MTKRKNKKRKILFLIIVILLFVALYFHFLVSPQIVSANISQIKSKAVNIMNSTTSQTIASSSYDNLVTIHRDNENNITLLEVNSKNVNKLNNDILTNVQNELDSGRMLEYSLPLGTFSGLPILSGIGPDINLKISQIGNVKSKFNSQITSLSINQSFHKIYLTISINICIFLPLYTQNVTITNNILIAESIIVGKIPSTYLNSDSFTTALNLVP